MTAILDVLLAVGVGLALDHALRCLLVRLSVRHISATLRLQGWTEVCVSVTPLPGLLACWRMWRILRAQHRSERKRHELLARIEAANVLGISCGFVTPNEARERMRVG